MRLHLWFAPVVLAAPLCCQPVVFQDVQARYNRSAKDRRLVETSAVLTLDDSAGKLIVKSAQQPLDIKYEDVQEVILDQRYSWCYLECRRPEGGVRPYMLRIGEDTWDKVAAKMKEAFGGRVSVYQTRRGEKIETAKLKDIDSSHSVTVDRTNRPMPEVKPDKALVVSICLPVAARYAGKGNQVKLHANDQVIAVNKMGTYSFAHLDPGEYLMVSQTENADSMKLQLEAGKEYYFLQDVYMGAWKSRTGLSMHARKIGLYELTGAYYSNWKRNK